MSEEVQETVEVDESNVEENESQEDNLTLEDWKAIALKARTEAKNRRLSNKDTQAKLAEYDEWKKSQLSESDRLKAEKSELEAELRTYKKGNLQVTAAKKAGLPADLADLLVGDSEAEMVQHAKSILNRLNSNEDVRDVLRPGARGGEVKSDTNDINKWFRSHWQ